METKSRSNRYAPKQEVVGKLSDFLLRSCGERNVLRPIKENNEKSVVRFRGDENIENLLTKWTNSGTINPSHFYDLKNELKILLKGFSDLYGLDDKDSYALARQILMNKENTRIRNWQKKAFKDDFYRFKQNLRSSISTSIKKNKFYPSTEKILGCDLDTFVNELVTKSSEDTEIDHIVPMSLANNNDEAIALNHHSNLQVVSKEYNRFKKNRFIKKKNLDKVISRHRDPKLIKKIVERSGIKII